MTRLRSEKKHSALPAPPGYYTLALAHPTERMVACRLLELYRQQAAAGLVQAPTALCFTSCMLDGQVVAERGNPFKVAVPREGVLQVRRRGWLQAGAAKAGGWPPPAPVKRLPVHIDSR